MPTYEYKCDACGHAFEQFQSITADPIRKCPACKKLKVKRLIGTGAGLIFKGSGFYITDYRDKSYTDKAKAESGNGAATESKSGDSAASGESKKAESKPAADAAPAPAAPKAESKAESKSSPKRSGKSDK